MKVKIKTSIASSEWSYIAGQVVELSDGEAAAWIKGGIADPLAESFQASAYETAALDPVKPRRGR